MSLNNLSKALKAHLWTIGASSHTINLVIVKSLSSADCLFTKHRISELNWSEILNLECHVRPAGNKDAATPNEGVANAIRFQDCTPASIALYKYVFLVPPGHR